VIPLGDQALLRRSFESGLTSRIRIDLVVQKPTPIIIPGRPECPFCEDAQTLMREIASLSPRINLAVHDFYEEPSAAGALGVDKVPGIVIRGGSNRAVRFFGMPTGAEFPGFIQTLMEFSAGTVPLEAESQRKLKRIRDDVKIEVYVQPSCEYSPAVTRTAFRLPLASKKLHVSAIEAREFPQLLERYGFRATPTIFVDEALVLTGAIDEATLLDCLLRHVEHKPLADIRLGAATPLPQPGQEPEVRISPAGLIIPR
jgi:glutaredoxin-like protein